MDGVIQSFTQLGALGITCAALFYMVVILQQKLLSIVENNTKAITELKGVIDKCQVIHNVK